MKIYLLTAITMFVLSCKTSTQETAPITTGESIASAVSPIVKTDEEWKAELTEQEYYVLREAGTERAFTSDLLENKQEGMYVCAGCQLPLFSSTTKFKSGTGWPSFYQPAEQQNIIEDTDYKIGYARTEIRCARCDGHQGHVFEDGPKPTGLRYCINGVALDFIPNE